LDAITHICNFLRSCDSPRVNIRLQVSNNSLDFKAFLHSSILRDSGIINFPISFLIRGIMAESGFDFAAEIAEAKQAIPTMEGFTLVTCVPAQVRASYRWVRSHVQNSFIIHMHYDPNRGGEINCPCCPSCTFGAPDK